MQTAAKSVVIAESSWEESVSAWMDGEESDDVLAGLLTREGQQTWDTYHLIGDALRNSDLALTPSAAFQARLARALDAELPIVAAPRRVRPAHGAVRPGRGRRRRHRGLGGPTLSVRRLAGRRDRVLADASAGVGTEDASLRDYLEAHRQMAGPSAVRQVSFDAGRAADGRCLTRWPALGRAATWLMAAWFAATLFAAFLLPTNRSRGRRHARRRARGYGAVAVAHPAGGPQAGLRGRFHVQQGETIQSSVWSMCWTAPASASA